MWQKIISIINEHEKFVITSHINPDCDALGSELALATHLRAMGKSVLIMNSDPVPPNYWFIDRKNKAKRFHKNSKHLRKLDEAEVIIVVDASGGWERIGRVGQKLSESKAIKICIDHHPDPVDFVDVAVVDTDAAAAAELIYSLLVEMGATFTPHMAQALYTGIMTDTGGFRFPKTSPRTHQITAELLTHGADPLFIYKQIYEQSSAVRLRLKGHVLSSIETAADGQIAYYSLDQKTFKEHNIEFGQLNGFAGLGQEIKGVRVTIYCVEASPNRVKISLRTDGSVSINQLAIEYGGGGHPSAAGASAEGQVDEVIVELVKKVTYLLTETKTETTSP
ncbi:bifunctional oligoribonuclease/PAP phosphatase NrnA [Anaerolineales bacterium HSG6]|nr:bifunctional oligoribonuclease/PAP phosphatase NrnA [Anaerolineales bacterium HSG6]MDM8530785.1 bifunctional oligoribonuclease/PAP phosphatase NrnA [Anaerolineales bacterium HSG25]